MSLNFEQIIKLHYIWIPKAGNVAILSPSWIRTKSATPPAGGTSRALWELKSGYSTPQSDYNHFFSLISLNYTNKIAILSLSIPQNAE